MEPYGCRTTKAVRILKSELSFPNPMFRPHLAALFSLTLASSQAVEIRAYSSARHDRFVVDGGGIAFNPDAYYVSSRYSGVGFATDGGDPRQYTLVTPEHVLFARHYLPANGTNIRFLNAFGQEFNRTTISSSAVPNGSGGFADVIIIKLSSPLPADQGITPIPYLNLANEALYNNTVLTVFGQNRRAGRGRISSFSDFDEPGIDTTRTFTFLYSTIAGNQDDCYVVTGDSGSPSFAIANNRPALVGLHLAAGGEPGVQINIDTFVPQYAPAINSLLAPDGYQLTPAYPATVSLTAGISNDPLSQAAPATLEISIANSTANTATNPRLNLVFPTDAIPTGISAPGWIITNPSPGDYRLRSATLAGNSSSTATITYDSVPILSQISIQATHGSDGSPTISETFDLPVMETFAGFVSALPLKGESDDPDLDGIGNLLEYAFGGDPGANSQLAAGGYPLAPQSSGENGLTFTYARRTDAAQRGLTYQAEFSETLETGSWSTTLPPGTSVSAAPFDPDVPGFEKVILTMPTASPDKLFVRVKITLAE